MSTVAVFSENVTREKVTFSYSYVGKKKNVIYSLSTSFAIILKPAVGLLKRRARRKTY